MFDILSTVFAISVGLIILSLKRRNPNKKLVLVSAIVCIACFIGIYTLEPKDEVFNKYKANENITETSNKDLNYELSNIPNYEDSPYVNINNGVPFFDESDLVTSSYEKYSELDNLRKMWCNNCMYRKRFNANRRKGEYRQCKTNRLANGKI